MIGINKLLSDIDGLKQHLRQVLQRRWCNDDVAQLRLPDYRTASAVLLLLEARPDRRGRHHPGMVLSKRSAHVKQPGDICCPGGGFTPRLDEPLARLLRIPGLPWLARRHSCNHNGGSPYQDQAGIKDKKQDLARQWLSLVLAAGLRECFEEMGLNPLRASLLGPLPTQQLQMFRRSIYPLAVWIRSPRRFRLNREVEKVVRIPLADLLDPARYARYCLNLGNTRPERLGVHFFPCFQVHAGTGSNKEQRELLWGATYRIVMSFLKLGFDFSPPHPSALPVIMGKLPSRYLGTATA